MARMIPSVPRADTTSKAELRIFGVMQRELSDEWIALHSLGLTIHPSKPWTEVDFVLIGPSGIYCLEVKGGRVEFRYGMWHFTDADGNVTVRRDGPFEQVGPAAASLYSYLADKRPGLAQVPVGYGVVTPDIVWKVTGPSYETDVIYDEDDRRSSFAIYMKRVAGYWHDRLKRQRGRLTETLCDRERAQVLDMLRGDFDLCPSLRTRIGHAKEELLALTAEQYRVLDCLSDNERIIIRGGAGTGKTLLAVEEARRQARVGRDVLLVCFNSLLADHLGRTVADVPQIRAVSLHRLMYGIIEETGFTDRLPDVCQEDLYEVFYPDLCLEGLPSSTDYEAYDSLVVDEGQDILRPNYIEVLDSLLKGGMKEGRWAVFLDPFQNLYGGLTPEGLDMLGNRQPARFSLNVNCRNTAPVAVATQILSGLSLAGTQKTSGPDVEFYWYRDASDQRRQLRGCLSRVLSNRVSPSSVVILSKYGMARSAVQGGVSDISCQILEMTHVKHGDTRVIAFSTIGAFKGLEADCVIVVDIDDLSTDLSRTLLYEGCSRAIAFLALFIKDELQAEYKRLAFEFGERCRRAESDRDSRILLPGRIS